MLRQELHRYRNGLYFRLYFYWYLAYFGSEYRNNLLILIFPCRNYIGN